MPSVRLIFAILGALFLVLGTMRFLRADRPVPQAKAWLIIGVIFSMVAAWLYFHVPSSP